MKHAFKSRLFLEGEKRSLPHSVVQSTFEFCRIVSEKSNLSASRGIIDETFSFKQGENTEV